MQFTSVPFYLFLAVVVVLYYLLPYKYRNYLLLAASYYFYFSVKPEYLLILVGSTAVNFFIAKDMDNIPRLKKFLLGTALVLNLGVLFFFKYFNFFGDQLNSVFQAFSLNLSVPRHSLILPVGISFYTFMALGYVLDVYWGDIKHQRNYLTFSLYLAFFPQILCGPIGRAKNLFKQFTAEHPLVYDNFANGFRLILWGLFKKMVVADNIGVYVDAVYGNIPMHSSLTLIVAGLLYPMQLYADFSGYTDIARGVAKLLGFDLMVNFRTPYVNSTSITEFWRRNHISLTSWVREYVFYPFMGCSTVKLKVYFGILVMFLVMGIWHGAGWMFILWGMLQALYLIFEDITGWDKIFSNKNAIQYLKRLITYGFISLGLLFFRLPTLTNFREYAESFLKFDTRFFTGGSSQFAFIIVGLVILVIIELALDKRQLDDWVHSKAPVFRWSMYMGLALVTILIGNVDGKAFIYFQF